MKKIILSVFVLASMLSYSQTTPKVTEQNGVKTYDLDTKVPKTMEQQIGKATKTLDVAIYKTVTYPVYITKKGKKFIVYPNKEKTGYNKKYLN